MIVLLFSVIVPLIAAKLYVYDKLKDDTKTFVHLVAVLVVWLLTGLMAALSTYVFYAVIFNSAIKYLSGEVWYEDRDTWLGRNVYSKFGAIGAKILFGIEILMLIITILTNG